MKQLPPREFAASVRDYCAEHELLRPGDRVLVGVSGGPDSTALFLVLHELAARLGLTLAVAHLDH
ncbi:MAG: ATP-binding protein, partial [bacterium]